MYALISLRLVDRDRAHPCLVDGVSTFLAQARHSAHRRAGSCPSADPQLISPHVVDRSIIPHGLVGCDPDLGWGLDAWAAADGV